MYQINLYIETSAKGPSKRKSVGMYVLEFIRENGEPVTRNGLIYMDAVTEDRMVLELLLEALKRITKSCSLAVFTANGHVFNVIKFHRLSQWEKNGWKNAKGKTSTNMLLWQQIKEYLDMHSVDVTDADHSYKKFYMKNMIDKELKRDHTECVERRKDV